MSAPLPDVPADWTPIEPFPRASTSRSFVSDDPGGDRLRVAYFRRGQERILRAKAWFGPGAEGPPGQAHGGAVAAVLDESVGAVAWMLGHRVVVARLAIDFRNPVPLGADATVEATVVAVDGRKITCRARLGHEGRLLAEAEALCVTLRA